MKEFTLLKNKKMIKYKNNFFEKIHKNDKLEITLSCVILLFLWQFIALKINNDIYLPTIGEVIGEIKSISQDKRFYFDIYYSIGRCFISFVFALIFSFLIGVMSYSSRIFRNFLTPINTIVQSIPTMILVVLALIWFDKDNAPFIVGFAIVFPILYESILGALLGIDKGLLEMAKLYKVSRKDKISKIYFPAIKFRLTSILVSTFSLALKVVIAGEVYGQPTYGMGTMIQVEKMNFNTSGIFAWLVIIVFISILLDWMQKLLSRRMFVWKR